MGFNYSALAQIFGDEAFDEAGEASDKQVFDEQADEQDADDADNVSDAALEEDAANQATLQDLEDAAAAGQGGSRSDGGDYGGGGGYDGGGGGDYSSGSPAAGVPASDGGAPAPPSPSPDQTPAPDVPADAHVNEPITRDRLTAATHAADFTSATAVQVGNELFQRDPTDDSLTQVDNTITATLQAGNEAVAIGQQAQSEGSVLIKQLGKLTEIAGKKALTAAQNLSDSLISAMEAIANKAAQDAEGYVKKLTEGGTKGPAATPDADHYVQGLAREPNPVREGVPPPRVPAKIVSKDANLLAVMPARLPVAPSAPARMMAASSPVDISDANRAAARAASVGQFAINVGQRAKGRQGSAGQRAIAAGRRAITASNNLLASAQMLKGPARFNAAPYNFKQVKTMTGYEVMGATSVGFDMMSMVSSAIGIPYGSGGSTRMSAAQIQQAQIQQRQAEELRKAQESSSRIKMIAIVGGGIALVSAIGVVIWKATS